MRLTLTETLLSMPLDAMTVGEIFPHYCAKHYVERLREEIFEDERTLEQKRAKLRYYERYYYVHSN